MDIMSSIETALIDYKMKNIDEPNVVVIGKKLIAELKETMPMVTTKITAKDSFILGCLVIESDYNFCFFAKTVEVK